MGNIVDLGKNPYYKPIADQPGDRQPSAVDDGFTGVKRLTPFYRNVFFPYPSHDCTLRSKIFRVSLPLYGSTTPPSDACPTPPCSTFPAKCRYTRTEYAVAGAVGRQNPVASQKLDGLDFGSTLALSSTVELSRADVGPVYMTWSTGSRYLQRADFAKLSNFEDPQV